MRRLLLLLILLGVVGCAVHNDPPLPEVKASDPIWTPVPDHLSVGELPL